MSSIPEPSEHSHNPKYVFLKATEKPLGDNYFEKHFPNIFVLSWANNWIVTTLKAKQMFPK